MNVLFATLLISYPLAWLLIGWGLRRYWQEAGFKECFLLGWALGCVALTLSGPFYPYPDRGLMTLQVPLCVIAGAIYFRRFARVKPLVAVAAVLILAGTPAYVTYTHLRDSGFNPELGSVFMSAEHRAIVDTLGQSAAANDILIVDKAALPWRTDDLWLAPDYPGKFYCGHFFLTVDYERKCAEVVRFFDERDPSRQTAFLREKGIRFVYVQASREPARFAGIPGFVVLSEQTIGTLFEYDPRTAVAR
jgi:hypothetical protein